MEQDLIFYYPPEYEPKNLNKWRMPQYYYGEVWPDYYSSGFGQSRDSDALERSNFACMLDALGGETETVIVVREGHFLVGWVEWIAIHVSDTTALQVADEIQEKLKDYPVIDEEHWGELESEEATEVWQKCYDVKERIAYIRKNRDQFEFYDFTDMLAVVRGKYFIGYASELLY